MGLRYLTGVITPNAPGKDSEEDGSVRPACFVYFREKFDLTCVTGDVLVAHVAQYGSTGPFTKEPSVLLGIQEMDAGVITNRCKSRVFVDTLDLSSVRVAWSGVSKFHFLVIGETAS